MTYIFILIPVFFLLSQDTINVIIRNESNALSLFERAFIAEIIKKYHAKSQNHYEIKYTKLMYFKDIFKLIDLADNKDRILGINAVNITDERKKKYDFSSPYLPIKKSLISDYYSQIDPEKLNEKEFKIGYLEKSVHEAAAIRLSKHYKLQLVSFKDTSTKLKALHENLIDLYVGDRIEAWVYENLKVLTDIEDEQIDYFGILYPKNSSLKKELDPIIQYFRKSSSFYLMVKKHLGEDAVTYFKTIK